MNIDIPLTKPQREFAFSKDNHPAIVGGLGSGKSRAGTIRLILLMLKYPGINTAYYMPTYDLLKLRAMPGVEEDLTQLGLTFKVNKSEYKIDIKGLGFIIFRSYDKPERIIAYEVAHSIVDEIDTLSKEKAEIVWRKVSERNRQKCPTENTIGCVTTPDHGIHGFVYDKWKKKAQPGYSLIKASTRSNPFLPKGYIQQILDNYDSVLAELYIDGEFVSLTESKIYHFFNRKKHNSDRVLTEDDTSVSVSIDFNVGGCCAVVWIEDGGIPVAVDEFVSYDTRDFVNNLTLYESDNRAITVFPDSSGGNNSTNASATDIEIIENAGYYVDCPNANPYVRDRINSVNGLLSHRKMMVNFEKCPELKSSLESQGYDKKTGKPEKFDTHPSIDDWNDSAGYFINRRYPVTKPMTTLPVSFAR